MIKLNMMYSCESFVYIWLNKIHIYTKENKSNSKKTLCSQKPDFQSSILTFFRGVLSFFLRILFLKTEYWLPKHIIGLKLIVCLSLQRPQTYSIHSHHVKLQGKCGVSFLKENNVLLYLGWVQESHGSLGSTTKPHVNLWICISSLVVETKVTLGVYRWICLLLSYQQGLKKSERCLNKVLWALRTPGCLIFLSLVYQIRGKEDALIQHWRTNWHIWLHIIYNAVSSQRAWYTYCWSWGLTMNHSVSAQSPAGGQFCILFPISQSFHFLLSLYCL